MIRMYRTIRQHPDDVAQDDLLRLCPACAARYAADLAADCGRDLVADGCELCSAPNADLLSSAEVGALCGVSPRRITALIAAGRLAATQVSGAWVIRRADALALAAAPRPAGWAPGRRRH